MSEKENLNDRLKELEKNFGLTKASKLKNYETIRTKVYGLDFVLDGIKIIEGGHKLEFYGKESTGKTTFALKVVKRFQELDKVVVWIVSESFHKDWAEKMGVDTSQLLLYYPECVEDAGDKILAMIGKVDLIVLDSVASLIPESELNGSLSDKTRGAQAKAYSEFCRKLYSTIAHKTTTLLFINQIRIVMGKLYGNPEDTPCGKALKFMYDTRIEFRAGKPIDKGVGDKKERLGVELHVQGYKNKLGTAKRTAIIDFYFKDGRIDNSKSLLFAGLKYGVIELSGHTYTFGKKKAVGKEKFCNLLTEEDYKKIEEQVWERLK